MFTLKKKYTYLTLVILAVHSLSIANDKDKESGSVSIGFTQTTGNTETSTLKASASYKNEGDIYRYFADLSVLYGVSNGDKTAERINLDARAERRFYPYFVFWDFRFYRNPFQAYSYSIGTGPGIGRYILDTDRYYLTLGYYVHRIYNRLTDEYTSLPVDRKIERYFLHHIEERFKFKINENLKFKEKLIYKVSSRSLQDYFVYVKLSIENKMTDNLYLEIAYNINYQNKPVGSKIERTDTIFMTSLKYKF